VKPIYVNTVYAPLVRRVTVVDDQFTHLNWFRNDSNRNAMSRFLIKRLSNSGGGALSWTIWEPKDSLVLRDLNVMVDQQSYSYVVRGIDVCEDTSAAGLLAKSILLNTRINDEYHAELSWTEYEKWRSGVKEYIIQMDRGTGFRELTRVSSSTVNYVHESQEYNCIDRIEYRVIAVPVEEGPLDSNWYFNSCSNESSPVQKPKVFIPNAFTPNANELNEVFKPEGIFIKSYHMKIFDRWGEKLYDQKGCNQGWDGTFMGDKAPSGVYVYQLTVWGIDGSMHQFKGDVTLIR
jgi:gliding motility-associated-like protein